MPNIRMIPFGYYMENGQILLHPAEAPAVEQIFGDYLAGFELNQIIGRLHVPYNEDVIWKQKTVTRILDNPNYIGNEDYPPIIAAEVYQAAAVKRHTAHVRFGIQSPELHEIRKVLICRECSNKLTRCTRSKPHIRWNCKNPECSRFPFYLTDEMVIGGVLQCLNTAIENPELLHAEESAEYTPNTAICRQQNEISRMMESPQTDTERIQSELYRLAQMQYDACTYSDAPQKTAKLRNLLARCTKMDTLDLELVKQVVIRVAVSHSGNMEAEMLGGTVITIPLEGSDLP